MKNATEVIHFTMEDVAKALDIDDYMIAQEMFDGTIRFTDKELEVLANYKGVPLEIMLEDDALADYRDPVLEMRKTIALRLLKKKVALSIIEFATELTRNEILGLKKK